MNNPPTKNHGYYDYSAITDRPDFSWPDGKRLAFYLGVNLETFSFGNATGPTLNDGNHSPDVMNYSWRAYGNRVGVWRFLELFDELGLPATALINTDMYGEASPVLDAFRSRGDDFVAHGRTNAEMPGKKSRDEELQLLRGVRKTIENQEGKAPKGYLAPHISYSENTPELLCEAGYEYLLDWAMDDQPVWMNTAKGKILSVPYSQEINDIPQIVGRNRTGKQFGEMIEDAFTTYAHDAKSQPRVMSVALHPYLMGQAQRFNHLRRALANIRERAGDDVWFTSPGEINSYYRSLNRES